MAVASPLTKGNNVSTNSTTNSSVNNTVKAKKGALVTGFNSGGASSNFVIDQTNLARSNKQSSNKSARVSNTAKIVIETNVDATGKKTNVEVNNRGVSSSVANVNQATYGYNNRADKSVTINNGIDLKSSSNIKAEGGATVRLDNNFSNSNSTTVIQ